jgi:hypothetical protein
MEREKKACTFKLTQKQIKLLDQLHKESGMNKSEIIGTLIKDYFDSIKKKICP